MTRRRSTFAATAILIAGFVALDVAAQALAHFDLPRQALADSLRAVASQANMNVLFERGVVEGRVAPALNAQLTPAQALTAILAGTGLSHRFVDEKTVTITSANPREEIPATDGSSMQSTSAGQGTNGHTETTQTERPGTPATNVAQARQDRADAVLSRDIENDPGIFEVLVTASRILNMDIKRSEDDAQPYVIFDRTAIERSGATNLQDFLKQRLTMNTVGSTPDISTGGDTRGNLSQINLRGLGSGQTLVLIDGHRTTNSSFGSPSQVDLNGIPLSAIERIEVLPTTASGIYGGSATGGVVNVILRRDYSGVEFKVGYENTVDSDSGIRRAEGSLGFAPDEGRTSILISASWSDQNLLLAGDRDFLQRGRANLLANNPSSFLTATTPPLGATPNITARPVGGIKPNLTLRADLGGTPLGSPITFVPQGYSGFSSDSGAALVANAGNFNLDLAATSQFSGGSAEQLVASPATMSGSVTIRRQFSPGVHAFLEGGVFSNESSFSGSGGPRSFNLAAGAPNNPFAQAVTVTVPYSAGNGTTDVDLETLRAVAGVIFDLPGRWQGEVDHAWSRSRHSYNSPPTIPGATAANLVIRDTMLLAPGFGAPGAPLSSSVTPFESVLHDSTARFSGPVASLPAGDVRVSFLLEHREETYEEAQIFDFGATLTFPSRAQEVDSVYLETTLPLVSALNRRPGLYDLELQLAGRHDEYQTDAVTSAVVAGQPIIRSRNDVDSTDPTFALRYQPVEDVTLRASFGTGFLPPTVAQALPSNTPGTVTVNDPQNGGASVTVSNVITGGNPGLEPEDSETRSFGLVFTPRFLDGLRLSVDYVDILKTSVIGTHPLGVQGLVNDEAIFPGRITRDASGTIVAIDASLLNVASARIEAYDAQVDYRFDTERFGTFEWFALGTWQRHLETRTLDSQPWIENAGSQPTSSGSSFGLPVKFKGNGGLSWSRGDFTLGWSARYFDSYLVANPALSTAATVYLNQGGRKVPHQIYHDVVATWRPGPDNGLVSGFLKDMEVQLGAKNVLDESPPYDAGNTSSFYSRLGDPRMTSYYLAFRAGL